MCKETAQDYIGMYRNIGIYRLSESRCTTKLNTNICSPNLASLTTGTVFTSNFETHPPLSTYHDTGVRPYKTYTYNNNNIFATDTRFIPKRVHGVLQPFEFCLYEANI